MALSLANALTEVAKEDLAPGIRDTLPEISGLFRDIKTSWEGVERSLGRPARNATGAFYAAGWVKRWILVAGGGGSFKMTNPDPQLVADLGTDGNEAVWNGTTTGSFPGAADFVFPKYANPFVGLREGRGTLAMPWQLLRTNKIENVLVDIGAENIAKSAELTAMSEAVQFFSRNPNWGEICRTTIYRAAGGVAHTGVKQERFDGTGDHKYLTISTWWKEDSVTKFRPGQSVDIYEVNYDHTGGTHEQLLQIRSMDEGGFVVDQIDYLNQKVSFVTKDGAVAANDLTVCAANDTIFYIVLLQATATLGTGDESAFEHYDAGLPFTYSATDVTAMDAVDAYLRLLTGYTAYGFDGLNDFVKTSASQYFYGVPIGRMPNLMSLYVENVGDYLTERYWNKIIGWFRSQYGERFMPDTIITTYGVLNGALQQAFRFEPGTPGGGGGTYVSGDAQVVQSANRGDTGSPGIDMDFGGVRLGHRGRRFKLYDDPVCLKENLFALKTRDDNLMRLVPPPIEGSGKQAQFQDVEFVNNIVFKSIWAFAHNSAGAQTDFMVAPYVLNCNHYIKDPQSIRLRGLTEAVGA